MNAQPNTLVRAHPSSPYPSASAFVSGTPNSSVVSMPNMPSSYFINGGSQTMRQQQQAIHTPASGASVPLPTSAGTKLFVGQVPAVCSEDLLYPIFAQFGPLLEVKIMREPNGRSKGSAWVRYVHEEHAKAAIAALHERQVVPPQTNPLRVQLAAPSGLKVHPHGAPVAAAGTQMIVPIAYQQAPYAASPYVSNAAAAQQQQQQQTTFFAAPPASFPYGVSPSILTISQPSIMDNQSIMASVQYGGRAQRSAAASYYTVEPPGSQQQTAMNNFYMPTYTMMPHAP